MLTNHILKLDCGISCTLVLNELTVQVDCYWNIRFSDFSKHQRDEVRKHYYPWRDQIIADWCEKTGNDALIIE